MGTNLTEKWPILALICEVTRTYNCVIRTGWVLFCRVTRMYRRKNWESISNLYVKNQGWPLIFGSSFFLHNISTTNWKKRQEWISNLYQKVDFLTFFVTWHFFDFFQWDLKSIQKATPCLWILFYCILKWCELFSSKMGVRVARRACSRGSATLWS